MSMFSPSATYHAALRQELDGVARILAVQRFLRWAARGLAVGLLVDLGIVAWAWTQEAVFAIPVAALVAIPLFGATLGGIVVSLFVRHHPGELARRVDRVAGLQERSLTALELGGRGEEHPLAVAQMRDAVEHLKRLEPLEAFPIRPPIPELVTSAVIVLVGVGLAAAPNPWAIRARTQDPAIAAAREQAQRVDRLAESLQTDGSTQIQDLREILKRGARVIDSRSDQPEQALTALEDLEERLRQMSAGDDQYAAALAAIASALAGDPTTNELAQAINTGDMREIARASRSLAQRTDQMDQTERDRVARTLRDASNRAGSSSPALQSQLGDAANALSGGGQNAQSQGADGQQSGTSQSGGQQGQGANQGRSAQDALNDLADSAGATGERQRAQSQLQGSRNALERALGRSQSRSGNSGQSAARNNSSSSDLGLGSDQGDGSNGGDPSQEGTDPSGGQNGGGDQGQGDGNQPGQSGYGTGSNPNQGIGGVTNLDPATRPEQVGSSGGFSPDETSDNPYLGEGQNGTSQVGDSAANPSFTRGNTQSGNDGGNIPLGLRDLVKDYFSSIDPKNTNTNTSSP